MDFIFRDKDMKLYQTFTGDNERAELIMRNMLDLQVVYPQVDLYYNYNNPVKDELGNEWKNNQDIYELFIMKFNTLGGKILSAWNPKR